MSRAFYLLLLITLIVSSEAFEFPGKFRPRPLLNNKPNYIEPGCPGEIPPSWLEPPRLDRVVIQNEQFVDPFGRTLIFHGVNVDNKSAIYDYAPNVLSQQYVETVANVWGLNVIRLTFSWAQYEPTRGYYNLTYLRLYESVVDQYAALGIYTLFDMHQDEYSDNYCGEGFPNWATIVDPEFLGTFPMPEFGNLTYPLDTSNPYGGVLSSYCIDYGNNGLYYFSYITGDLFQNFYDNVNGIQDDFINMYVSVVQHFQGNTNILGYEIINEPFPGSLYTDPNLFLNSSYGDLINLQPFYDKLAQAVRQVDSQVIIFFEPLVTNGEVLARKAGFTHPPGYNNQAVLSFHTYCDITQSYAYDCLLAGSGYSQDCDEILAGDLGYCNTLFEDDFTVRIQDGKSIGIPAMVTEFGSFTGNATVDAGVNQFIAELGDIYGVSWIKWDTHDLDQFPYLIPAIVRTYAQAVAGTQISQFFNASTNIYTLSYLPNLNVLPTEIFVPVSIHYPNGFNVATSPTGYLTWTQSGYVISVWNRFFVPFGQKVTVTISPKSPQPTQPHPGH